MHAGIDGYSRLVTYFQCSNNNRFSTVLRLFSSAVGVYGYLSRVRSDHGGENIDVARFMFSLRGLNRGSHITGQSTRNQRVERIWTQSRYFIFQQYDWNNSKYHRRLGRKRLVQTRTAPARPSQKSPNTQRMVDAAGSSRLIKDGVGDDSKGVAHAH